LAGPQGLKLEARSAESGGGALGHEGLLLGLGSGVSRQRQGFDAFQKWRILFLRKIILAQELGAPVH